MKNEDINLHQSSRSEDPVWFFLGEFPLSELMPGLERKDELTVKLLLQTVRKLGMPSGCAEKIEMALTCFTKEARMHAEQGRFSIPGSIRVFCQGSGMKASGGWGYFLVDRSTASADSGGLAHGIDLYLYKEGE